MNAGSDAAIVFGQRMLGLLETASFTASYKYAVLLALLDAVLEGVDERGDPPSVVHAVDIGRRVLAIYWPQTRPFTPAGPLRQSSQRGSVVEKIGRYRREHAVGDLATVDAARRRDPGAFGALERDVVATVVRYPIPLLQKVGSGRRAVERRFIYEYGWAEGITPAAVHHRAFDDRMFLADDAGAHLVALAGLLRPVIQRDWLNFVARRNAEVEELRLQQYLFGSDRIALRGLAEPLLDLQRGECFYCAASSIGGWQVDHFLPWSRWPDNTLDNLVVADRRCNNDKRAALAALEHLDRWWQRFEPDSRMSRQISELAHARQWPRRAAATQRAARALYLCQPPGALLWAGSPGQVEPLDRGRLLGMIRTDVGLAADERGTYQG